MRKFIAILIIGGVVLISTFFFGFVVGTTVTPLSPTSVSDTDETDGSDNG